MERVLIELYPEFLHCDTMREILKTEEMILSEEEYDIENLIREFFIDTAQHTLPIWADFVGIDDNLELDIDLRRSNIKAALQSKGITTVEVIKNIVESYTNGKCEVIENYKDYSFLIRFVSKVGVPKRLEEIRKSIDRLKPAHLNYSFEFKYRTWGDIKAYNKNWKYYKDKKLTWNDLKGKEVI